MAGVAFIDVALSFARDANGSADTDREMDPVAAVCKLKGYFGNFNARDLIRLDGHTATLLRGAGPWQDQLDNLKAYALAGGCEYWHTNIIGPGVNTEAATQVLSMFAVRNILLTKASPPGVSADAHAPLMIVSESEQGITDATLIVLPKNLDQRVVDLQAQCRPETWDKLLLSVIGLVAHQVKSWNDIEGARVWYEGLTLDSIATNFNSPNEDPKVYVMDQKNLMAIYVPPDDDDASKHDVTRGWFQDRSRLIRDEHGRVDYPPPELEMKSLFASLTDSHVQGMSLKACVWLKELRDLATVMPYGRPPSASDEPARPPLMGAVSVPALHPEKLLCAMRQILKA